MEYFGKRGISLLGSTFVRQMKIIINNIQIEGLVYYLYDLVVHNYSSQDNVQVLAVVTVIMKKIKQIYPTWIK